MRGHAKLANAAGGVFAHGLAHLGLWVGSRDGSSADLPAGYLLEISLASRLGKWAQLFLFFFFLLRSVSEFVSIISSVGIRDHVSSMTKLIVVGSASNLVGGKLGGPLITCSRVDPPACSTPSTPPASTTPSFTGPWCWQLSRSGLVGAARSGALSVRTCQAGLHLRTGSVVSAVQYMYECRWEGVGVT